MITQFSGTNLKGLVNMLDFQLQVTENSIQIKITFGSIESEIYYLYNEKNPKVSGL